MSWALGALALVAFSYLAFGLLLLLRQERVLFHPSKESLCDPESAGIPFERCEFEAADGAKLEGWLLKPEGEPLCTVLFCIGNAGNISSYVETAALFRSLDCEVLLFNYRCYGASKGPFPTEEGVCLDAEAAWLFLTRTRGVKPERIFAVGRSLGGAVACELAVRRKLGALALESTFASIPAMAKELYPLYPAAWLARLKFDTLSKVSRLTLPTFVAHSVEDELVPFRQGKALFKASAGSPKSFISLTGPHNDCYFIARESYEGALRKFLLESFGGGKA